jgi:esterase/lipase
MLRHNQTATTRPLKKIILLAHPTVVKSAAPLYHQHQHHHHQQQQQQQQHQQQRKQADNYDIAFIFIHPTAATH